MVSKARLLWGLASCSILFTSASCRVERQSAETDDLQSKQEMIVSSGSRSVYKPIIETRLKDREEDLNRRAKMLVAFEEELGQLQEKCDKNTDCKRTLSEVRDKMMYYEIKLREWEGKNRDTNDCMPRLRKLENEVIDNYRKINEVGRELNRDVVGWLKLQAQWFAIFLTIVILCNIGAAWIGYKHLRTQVGNRVNPPLNKFKLNSEAILQSAYKNTIREAQRQIAFIDVSKKPPDVFADYVKQVLKQMDIETARLRVSFGKSDEVIAGANILSQIGDPDNNIPILRESLKREELSDEDRETLERAIRDLEKKRK
jgi:hypothetical protein